MYQVASSKAEEFIHDGEIVETLAYARENRANRPLIEAILQKAAEAKGSRTAKRPCCSSANSKT